MAKSPKAILKQGLRKLSTDHLLCRDIRHQWEVEGSFRMVEETNENGKSKYVTRTLVCSRCKTHRYDQYTMKDFERVTSHYEYPDGYIIVGNSVRHYGPDVRKEHFERVTSGIEK